MLPRFFGSLLVRTMRCGKFSLKLDRPLIMGIVNLTPDSFSGDGVAANHEAALRHAWLQIEAEEDMHDIGAESSRPGATPTSLADELDRLLPVLDALRDCGVPLSVDTYKPEVMRAALAHGADMVNDIFALRMPGALEAVSTSECGICLMHMQGEPLTMQQQPHYADVVAEVRSFLAGRVAVAVQAGVDASRLLLDPGFGFGKTMEHNVNLFKAIPEIAKEGLPLLAGVSRKSMLGLITGRPVEARLAASVASALLAAQKGAGVIRVHDVAETRDVLAIMQALAPPAVDPQGI